MKKENVIEPKTYVVYQDIYTNCHYNICEKENFEPSSDVDGYFDAEEGAEWFGYDVESLHLSADDIEDEGYTVEQIEAMDDKEQYDVLMDLVSEKDFADPDLGGFITECDEDYECSVYEVRDEDKGISFDMEVKYKFRVENGEIKREIIRHN